MNPNTRIALGVVLVLVIVAIAVAVWLATRPKADPGLSNVVAAPRANPELEDEEPAPSAPLARSWWDRVAAAMVGPTEFVRRARKRMFSRLGIRREPGSVAVGTVQQIGTSPDSPQMWVTKSGAFDGAVTPFAPAVFGLFVQGEVREVSVRMAAKIMHTMVARLPRSVLSPFARGSAGMVIYAPPVRLRDIAAKYFPKLEFDESCAGRCDGRCAGTCTADGRKWSTVVGVGGRISAVASHAAVNNSQSSHRRGNIAVHEFAHTLHSLMADRWLLRIARAYQRDRDAGVWDEGSYAMTNQDEYFAEATQAWFGVTNLESSGGMGGGGVNHITQAKSPQLWSLLKDLYGERRETALVSGTGTQLHFRPQALALEWK
jgi:hypothetical protein